jgi:hypothetical protein
VASEVRVGGLLGVADPLDVVATALKHSNGVIGVNLVSCGRQRYPLMVASSSSFDPFVSASPIAIMVSYLM